MNIDNIKTILLPYSESFNFTLAKKITRRNEFLFSLGESKFLPKEIIWEDDNYVLFGEGVEEKTKVKIKDIIKKTEV